VILTNYKIAVEALQLGTMRHIEEKEEWKKKLIVDDPNFHVDKKG
jgi:hypothetical protein